MALRDKLIERTQPLLPGEQIQQIFLAQSGVTPWASAFAGLLGQTLLRRRIVAVTDRSIVVLSTNFNGTAPNEVLRRLPRQTAIGPAKGIWARINVGDEKTWSHARFRKEIEAADAALGTNAR
ncbi:hypothetical protein DFJ67_6481 [Asanoa ferruginea]|uniref:PH (Pleckstrin Homology) domain-containing protein n=1 Tax=Asanoa ferruginea TaxID=53367 RepID=A0A3D9ZTE1_9ACTN|nr:hypothetical protein [Asanoa ferruginea]REG00428.1 hypothetical protein DFJ67_6481 [Asanoa ferruginea]GIF51000.1 hypothetical protein Afe04nite_55390 [Asanoa ferruginea]